MKVVRTLAFATSGVAMALVVAQAATRPQVATRTPPVTTRTVAAPATAGTGVLAKLGHVVTIGSTVDPVNGDVNPYGLAISPVTSGGLTKGDLIICNFNDNLNIQGLGTTIEVLHPTPGSAPARLAADGTLTGCDAIAMSPSGFIWAAAFDANDNPIVTPSGAIAIALSGHGLAQPFGQAFSGTRGPRGIAAFYESNANDGKIIRINITKNGSFTYDTIATGFSVNNGVPGSILGPSGLSYDASNDVLYIVDGNVNYVVAFSSPGKIPRNGITVTGSGFSGPSAASARVVFSGPPLEAPISSALLYNGDLVVGNTTNNRLFEISPTGKIVGMQNLDRGAPGALFGIAATGTSLGTTKIYFNDDNDNTVKRLEP